MKTELINVYSLRSFSITTSAMHIFEGIMFAQTVLYSVTSFYFPSHLNGNAQWDIQLIITS